jgi:hypothetical protein
MHTRTLVVRVFASITVLVMFCAAYIYDVKALYFIGAATLSMLIGVIAATKTPVKGNFHWIYLLTFLAGAAIPAIMIAGNVVQLRGFFSPLVSIGVVSFYGLMTLCISMILASFRAAQRAGVFD